VGSFVATRRTAIAVICISNEWVAIMDHAYIDERLRKSLAPTAFGLLNPTVKIQTSQTHKHAYNYVKDCEYFRANRRRNFLIRISNSGEFDPTIGNEGSRHMDDVLRSIWNEVPPLWVYVHQMMPGIHNVISIYRGFAFFPTVEMCVGRTLYAADNDDQISMMYCAMNIRRGASQEDMIALKKRYATALASSERVVM
jgi:hypothetical protein